MEKKHKKCYHRRQYEWNAVSRCSTAAWVRVRSLHLAVGESIETIEKIKKISWVWAEQKKNSSSTRIPKRRPFAITWLRWKVARPHSAVAYVSARPVVGSFLFAFPTIAWYIHFDDSKDGGWISANSLVAETVGEAAESAETDSWDLGQPPLRTITRPEKCRQSRVMWRTPVGWGGVWDAAYPRDRRWAIIGPLMPSNASTRAHTSNRKWCVRTTVWKSNGKRNKIGQQRTCVCERESEDKKRSHI